jgi:trk system potassium uptake protein TrkA
MYVLIAGGGRTGMQLSTLLLSEGYKVRLIEHRPELLEHLHQELPTEVIYEGLSTDPEVLESAGIRQAHILAACTADDSTNLVLCFMACQRFGVPHDHAPTTATVVVHRYLPGCGLNANVLSSLIRRRCRWAT